MIAHYELYGGPQDGGLIAVDGRPHAVIFVDSQPVDVGWKTGQQMTTDRLTVPWGRAPTGLRRHARYMWSCVQQRYVYDESVVTMAGAV